MSASLPGVRARRGVQPWAGRPGEWATSARKTLPGQTALDKTGLFRRFGERKRTLARIPIVKASLEAPHLYGIGRKSAGFGLGSERALVRYCRHFTKSAEEPKTGHATDHQARAPVINGI